MNTKVIYSTAAFLHKNYDSVGTQIEKYFSSIDDAKGAPPPEKCISAYIPLNNGFYLLSATHGWEFHSNN